MKRDDVTVAGSSVFLHIIEAIYTRGQALGLRTVGRQRIPRMEGVCMRLAYEDSKQSVGRSPTSTGSISRIRSDLVVKKPCRILKQPRLHLSATARDGV